MPSPPEIENFLSNKHDEYSSKGTKSIFHIFGANASSNAVVLNVYFEYPPFVDDLTEDLFRMTVRNIEGLLTSEVD